MSPKGLCLVGLVWNLEQKELYCQIKYIYGIINLKNIKNNKTETLKIHWANLKGLRNIVYHMLYGWQNTVERNFF